MVFVFFWHKNLNRLLDKLWLPRGQDWTQTRSKTWSWSSATWTCSRAWGWGSELVDFIGFTNVTYKYNLIANDWFVCPYQSHLCWLIICISVNLSLEFIGHISESGFHIRGVGGYIKVSHNFSKHHLPLELIGRHNLKILYWKKHIWLLPWTLKFSKKFRVGYG